MIYNTSNWPLVYNKNIIRDGTSVLINIPNIEKQDEDMPRVIRRE